MTNLHRVHDPVRTDTPSGEQAVYNNDEVPRTPRRRPRAVASSNIQISVEIPPEIALATEFNISLTPRSRHAYNMPRTPDSSPVRAQRIPPPDFGPVPPPSQPSYPAVAILGQHHAGVKSESEDRTESDDVVPAHSPDDKHVPALTQSALHGSGNAPSFGIVDNHRELDANLPRPVYPCATGEPQPPLPNIPHHPRRYYVIFKGLRIGVFYERWSDLVPLCKGLRGGRGHWKGFSDLRTAIIAFDTETDKIIIPNI